MGSFEYLRPGAEKITTGLFLGSVQHQSDGWSYVTDQLQNFLEHVLSQRSILQIPPKVFRGLLELEPEDLPQHYLELIGSFFVEMVRVLGQRTAELHLAFATPAADLAFDPEQFSQLYQRAVYQSMRTAVRQTMRNMTSAVEELPTSLRTDANDLLALEEKILQRLHRLVTKKITASRIRIHGDFHLGQILFTGKDFVIIDFEGDDTRPLSERRLKRSPFRDLVGMIRSFHHAAHSVLHQYAALHPEDEAFLDLWMDAWYERISAVFIHAYLARAAEAAFIPKGRDELTILLQSFLLDKNIRAIDEAVTHNPEDMLIPIKGIKHILRYML